MRILLTLSFVFLANNALADVTIVCSQYAPPNQTWTYTFKLKDPNSAEIAVDGFQTADRLGATYEYSKGNVIQIFARSTDKNLPSIVNLAKLKWQGKQNPKAWSMTFQGLPSNLVANDTADCKEE